MVIAKHGTKQVTSKHLPSFPSLHIKKLVSIPVLAEILETPHSRLKAPSNQPSVLHHCSNSYNNPFSKPKILVHPNHQTDHLRQTYAWTWKKEVCTEAICLLNQERSRNKRIEGNWIPSFCTPKKDFFLYLPRDFSYTPKTFPYTAKRDILPPPPPPKICFLFGCQNPTQFTRFPAPAMPT